MPINPQLREMQLKADAEALLATMIDEAHTRFNDPKQVKKLSLTELLEQIANIMKALKQTNITLNKNTNINLGKIQQYATDFADADKRREVRHELRRQLKLRPRPS